jgi:uncharacterized protein YecE (DUF72 family)
MTRNEGQIRVGIGGWTFAPWRGTFYPAGLPHAKELEYAASHLTSIEINGTFYRTQTPATFRKWAKEAPPGFQFSIKGPRYVTQRRVLAEARDSLKRFLDSGVSELGERLGPLLWQFGPWKQFEAADFGRFLELLPERIGRLRLRHAVEVRHESFMTRAFVQSLRDFGVAAVYADHETYPAVPDVTADFVYARLQRGRDSVPTAYSVKALGEWAQRARLWASGKEPADLPRLDSLKPARRPRDVYCYFIHEGKVRAPAAAMALIERLDNRR